MSLTTMFPLATQGVARHGWNLDDAYASRLLLREPARGNEIVTGESNRTVRRDRKQR